MSHQLRYRLAVSAKGLGTERKERWAHWGKPGKALQEVFLELDVKENDRFLGELGREGTVLTGHLSRNMCTEPDLNPPNPLWHPTICPARMMGKPRPQPTPRLPTGVSQ